MTIWISQPLNVAMFATFTCTVKVLPILWSAILCGVTYTVAVAGPAAGLTRSIVAEMAGWLLVIPDIPIGYAVAIRRITAAEISNNFLTS